MSNQVLLSVDYIPNPSIGKALSLADIYVGIVDLDPKTPANQKQISVLQENGTTVQVTQPITTSAGGVPLYNGSPVTILVDGSYSLRIDDSTGAQAYYVPKNAELESIVSFDTLADLKAITDTPTDGDTFTLLGYYSSGDGGGGQVYWDAASTSTDNGGTIIKVTSITTGRWKRLEDGTPMNAKHFGGHNSLDGTTYVQAYLDYCGSFFTPAANPRLSPLKIYFPKATYTISAPVTFNFGAGEMSGCEIYGDNVMQGSIISGTHAGQLFSYLASEHVEIHHLSFFGVDCSAIVQTNTLAYTNAIHIHHCEFNANLAECLVGNYILSDIEHNLFGYYGTATTNHRHINNLGQIGTNVSNINTVRHNKFFKATADYALEIISGNGWVFDDNQFETLNCPTARLTGVVTAKFINNWWESNDITAQGATPWEIKIVDSAPVEGRLISFKNNQMGATTDHDYWVHATTTADKLEIIATENTGNSFPVGFAFTNYDTVDDDGIVKWEFNTLSGYSRNDYDVTRYTADAFSARATVNSGAVTGDGTSYTVVYGVYDTGNSYGNVSVGTGIHTASNTGMYTYKAIVELNGQDVAHTTGWIELVTTTRTYRRELNPYAISIPGTYAGLEIAIDTWMNQGDTAKINVVAGGGTKTVYVIGVSAQTTTAFSGHRIMQG